MERNQSIDVLRAIGLLMVILAHVCPCRTVYEIRTFDVVLMVFVSGLTFSLKKDFNYSKYLKKRAFRLIIPTFIFLTAYFVFQYIFTGQIDLHNMVMSYSLVGGIGYVWIIRIFLLIMLVAPVIYKTTMKLSITQIILLYGVLIVMADVLTNISQYMPSVLQNAFSLIVIPIIGYSIPYSIAIKIKSNQESIRTLLPMVLVCLIVSMALHATLGNEILVHLYKYPPRSIYILYGVSVSILLYLSLKRLNGLIPSKLLAGGGEIGQNTIWIYFWHIPFVNFVNEYISIWELRYVVILLLSISCFALQYWIVNTCNNRFMNNYLVG